jgi:hypothetical protein
MLSLLRYLAPISSESAGWAGCLKGLPDPHKMRLRYRRVGRAQSEFISVPAVQRVRGATLECPLPGDEHGE